MHSTASPGPDGFGSLFFKHSWTVISADITALFSAFHMHSVDLERINRSYLVLLPKKEGARRPHDFRPIALQNSTVKSISRVLMNRLQPFIPSLIGTDQSGFVSGRCIADNFVYAADLLNCCYRRGCPTVLMKLDFHKAFDCVAWDSLTKIMKCRGFSDRWCAWINVLLSTGKTTILLNSVPGNWINCRRGLRQGDPPITVGEPLFLTARGASPSALLFSAHSRFTTCLQSACLRQSSRPSTRDVVPSSGLEKIAATVPNALSLGTRSKLPKNAGGLGIKDLELQNRCLLMKFVNKLFSGEQTSWKDWLLRSASSFDTPISGASSFLWRIVNDELNTFRSITIVKVNNGAATSFWFDHWLPAGPLFSTHHALFTHTTMPNISVQRVFQSGFDLRLRPRLTNAASHQLGSLLSLLQEMNIGDGPDLRLLKLTGHTYTARDAYAALDSSGDHTDTHGGRVWRTRLPTRSRCSLGCTSKTGSAQG
ncbi:uncharacterized protein [Miscanthus floridulus]|uniref:uncharacterized protein n=1 Tax=Miscanthus floridulus TaxID=154761 RepID=UPI00345997C0